MKNELGIEKECKSCHRWESCIFLCKGNPCIAFLPSIEVLCNRIRELQEQQFTEKEAEKVETFLTHGYQMIISKNKKIFSKLEKMKGEDNE